jgi:ankyrin repeat protein
MTNNTFQHLIEKGDYEGLKTALGKDSSLANKTIHWHLNQDNQSDPLHYIADCVFNGHLRNEMEGEITELFLKHGAEINGSKGREKPLIGAISLGSYLTAAVLIKAGAELESTSVFGARALHWAAWMGMSETVELLLSAGAEIEHKCSEYSATPLFWAVHGNSPHGPKVKNQQVKCAELLIQAGAQVNTVNKQRLSAINLAKSSEDKAMNKLLNMTLKM